ncbi:MAG: hypothetical protein B6U88_00745 [Candidatus Aenigmarchaeota archaeon ex4484_56]|nr:MAG: hypothetical protein B6U88_00745 [Candidatus Aenigmarchaeota archaeon ex4484_56]
MFTIKSYANHQKSITAKKMFKKFPEIRRKLWRGKLWNDGGCVGTIGLYKNLEV